MTAEDTLKILQNARNGKQCRERWLTALDPSINKAQWTIKDDIDFLEKWIQYGNQWREVAKLIDGRTESQVKNRFKLILRRDHIQQKTCDPEELKNKIVPQILENLKEKLAKGDDKTENDDETENNLASDINSSLRFQESL